MARDFAAYNGVVQTNPPADRLQYVARFSTADDVFHLSMEYNSDGTVRFFGGKLDGNDSLSNGTSTLGATYHTDAGYPVVGTLDGGAITLRAPLAAFGLSVGSSVTGASAFAMAGPAEAIEQLIVDPMRTVDATPPFDGTLAPQTLTPVTIACANPNVQVVGGWHEISDARATGGSYCRHVGTNRTNSLSFQFTGEALDVQVAKGPRGGILRISIDGVVQNVSLYRAPADPAHPDKGGRKDLDFNISVHRNVPPGTHSVRITNESTDAFRDMVYVDGFVITAGDVLTPAGHFVQSVGGLAIGTALAGLDTVNAFVVEPATELMDFIVEAAAGTTVTVKDPSGRSIATATVDDGGVIDLQALPAGAGAYALVLHASAAGDTAFTVWEVLTEQR
jgi:hypothetical protein